MTITTEYAKVVDGTVTQVIVADADFVSTLLGTWVLTPYDAEAKTGKVGIGFTYADGVFTAPVPPEA